MIQEGEYTMKNYIGYLIKYNRLKLNYSQEGLCKGICAVSYLSKIENGSAEPSPEIIDQLFKALNINYLRDEILLSKYKSLLFNFFDKTFHDEPTTEEEKELSTADEHLLYSELGLEYQLFRVYQLYNKKDSIKAKSLLKSLTLFKDYMNESTLFLYQYIYSYLEEDFNKKFYALQKADNLLPNSFVSLSMAGLMFSEGKYQEALAYCAIGYSRASDEGNFMVMKKITFIEGSSYANLFNHDLMLKSYKKLLELCRKDYSIQADVNYNIGASCIEKQKYTEAIPHLLSAYSIYKDDFKIFLVCHKLAIAYCELNKKDEGYKYLEEAQKIYNTDMPKLYYKMIHLVELRYKDNYLDSEEYFTLLKEIYSTIKNEIHYGFKQFHSIFMIELYIHRRKYKEAFTILKDMNHLFS